MSTEHHASWESVRSKIKHKWKKIDDLDLESLKGNLELISDRLQSLYSYPKPKADKEMKEFIASVEKPAHH